MQVIGNINTTRECTTYCLATLKTPVVPKCGADRYGYKILAQIRIYAYHVHLLSRSKFKELSNELM